MICTAIAGRRIVVGQLKGKVAVVTGASKGIGAGIAKALASAGAAVVVNYASSKEGADRVVADITKKGGKAVAIQADVSKADDVLRLFQETKKAFGSLDVLVNNAGVYQFHPLEGRHRSRVPPSIQHQRPRTNSCHTGSS
jgi:3-oxoacyl-[acyl-carrier protein] reductase